MRAGMTPPATAETPSGTRGARYCRSPTTAVDPVPGCCMGSAMRPSASRSVEEPLASLTAVPACQPRPSWTIVENWMSPRPPNDDSPGRAHVRRVRRVERVVRDTLPAHRQRRDDADARRQPVPDVDLRRSSRPPSTPDARRRPGGPARNRPAAAGWPRVRRRRGRDAVRRRAAAPGRDSGTTRRPGAVRAPVRRRPAATPASSWRCCRPRPGGHRSRG